MTNHADEQMARERQERQDRQAQAQALRKKRIQQAITGVIAAIGTLILAIWGLGCAPVPGMMPSLRLAHAEVQPALPSALPPQRNQSGRYIDGHWEALMMQQLLQRDRELPRRTERPVDCPACPETQPCPDVSVSCPGPSMSTTTKRNEQAADAALPTLWQ